MKINYKKLLVQLLLILCIGFGASFQMSLMDTNRGQAMAIYEITLLSCILVIAVVYIIGYFCYHNLKNRYWIWILLIAQLFVLYNGARRYYYYEIFEEIIGNPYIADDHFPPGYFFYVPALLINLVLFGFCFFKLMKPKK